MAEENENLEDEDFENQVLPLEVVELISDTIQKFGELSRHQNNKAAIAGFMILKHIESAVDLMRHFGPVAQVPKAGVDFLTINNPADAHQQMQNWQSQGMMTDGRNPNQTICNDPPHPHVNQQGLLNDEALKYKEFLEGAGGEFGDAVKDLDKLLGI